MPDAVDCMLTDVAGAALAALRASPGSWPVTSWKPMTAQPAMNSTSATPATRRRIRRTRRSRASTRADRITAGLAAAAASGARYGIG